MLPPRLPAAARSASSSGQRGSGGSAGVFLGRSMGVAIHGIPTRVGWSMMEKIKWGTPISGNQPLLGEYDGDIYKFPIIFSQLIGV